jgi:hypothetical protein
MIRRSNRHSRSRRVQELRCVALHLLSPSPSPPQRRSTAAPCGPSRSPWLAVVGRLPPHPVQGKQPLGFPSVPSLFSQIAEPLEPLGHRITAIGMKTVAGRPHLAAPLRFRLPSLSKPSVSPPSPRPPLLPPHSIEPLGARIAGEGCHRRRPRIWPELEEALGCFAFKPLWFSKISRSIYVSWQSSLKPPKKIPFHT